MTLTTEQRSQINRENAKKSQGPKSDAGKAKSRANALKHGLRAEVLALPNEKPEAIAARAESWNDYYQPASPAAQHLVNECVRATILSDRCHKYHDAMLAKQVREAEHAESTRDDLEIERIVARLVEDPANSVAALLRFGAGVEHLIGRWERLGQVLEADGMWNNVERDEAIRLQGCLADDDHLKHYELAWTTRLFAMLCNKYTNQNAIEWMMEAKRFPTSLWGQYGPELHPSRDECQATLKAMVARRLEELKTLGDELAQSIDIPNEESAADRALILQDEKSAKLFLRYLSESRSSFHRSFKELVKTLETDRAEGATPLAVSPNEPKIEAVAESEKAEAVESEAQKPDEPAVSPNEPNLETPVEAVTDENVSRNDAATAVPPEKRAA